MSDHGFTSWRRSFHLNSWLADNGYLTVDRSERSGGAGLFAQRRLVAHARLRARPQRAVHQPAGRERWGIVAPRDRQALVDEIRRACFDWSIRGHGRRRDHQRIAASRSTAKRTSTASPRISSSAMPKARAVIERVGPRRAAEGGHRRQHGASGAAITAWIRMSCPGILLVERPLSQPASDLGRCHARCSPRFEPLNRVGEVRES